MQLPILQRQDWQWGILGGMSPFQGKAKEYTRTNAATQEKENTELAWEEVQDSWTKNNNSLVQLSIWDPWESGQWWDTLCTMVITLVDQRVRGDSNWRHTESFTTFPGRAQQDLPRPALCQRAFQWNMPLSEEEAKQWQHGSVTRTYRMRHQKEVLDVWWTIWERKSGCWRRAWWESMVELVPPADGRV